MTDTDATLADDYMTKLPLVMKAKAKLIARGLTRGRARCSCSPKGTRTLRVRIAGRKNHARAACEACGFWLVE
ncbi:hypothetical protein [Roseovarius indicus]|uniref:Uncharacterized protein n=1 Tax=Roseovarius indicus TaxID=540747 RepID=A0A0T5P3D4_9RHOB|nr:hypothetical protein [Roseovarius indicus]KRS15635.1 hypothetical protein XM52_22605 [Roseovarius indicus]QEW27859.1 hypothetical protein RIdsm_03680 [Roseovarius indicus]SFE79119.1 hypothetical protein SAMN04488031_1227 [Roseovarius indicus]